MIDNFRLGVGMFRYGNLGQSTQSLTYTLVGAVVEGNSYATGSALRALRKHLETTNQIRRGGVTEFDGYVKSFLVSYLPTSEDAIILKEPNGESVSSVDLFTFAALKNQAKTFAELTRATMLPQTNSLAYSIALENDLSDFMPIFHKPHGELRIKRNEIKSLIDRTESSPKIYKWLLGAFNTDVAKIIIDGAMKGDYPELFEWLCANMSNIKLQHDQTLNDVAKTLIVYTFTNDEMLKLTMHLLTTHLNIPDVLCKTYAIETAVNRSPEVVTRAIHDFLDETVNAALKTEEYKYALDSALYSTIIGKDLPITKALIEAGGRLDWKKLVASKDGQLSRLHDLHIYLKTHSDMLLALERILEGIRTHSSVEEFKQALCGIAQWVLEKHHTACDESTTSLAMLDILTKSAASLESVDSIVQCMESYIKQEVSHAKSSYTLNWSNVNYAFQSIKIMYQNELVEQANKLFRSTANEFMNNVILVKLYDRIEWLSEGYIPVIKEMAPTELYEYCAPVIVKSLCEESGARRSQVYSCITGKKEIQGHTLYSNESKHHLDIVSIIMRFLISPNKQNTMTLVEKFADGHNIPEDLQHYITSTIYGLKPQLNQLPKVNIFVTRKVGDDSTLIVHDPFSLKALCIRKILSLNNEDMKVENVDSARSAAVVSHSNSIALDIDDVALIRSDCDSVDAM